MAETAEDTVKRLQEELAAGARAPAATAGESAEDTVARLQMADRRGEAGPFYRELPAQFNQSLANMIGLLGSPVIAPFLPSAPEGEPLSTMERIDERIGASRDATVGLFQRLGFIPENLGPPSTIAGHIGAGLPGAIATGGATVAAAPAVAARMAASTSPAAAGIGQIAEQIAARPRSSFNAVVGSQFPMVAARELARPGIEAVFDPHSESIASQAARSAALFVTELTGATAGSLVARGGRALADRSARAMGITIPNSERFNPRTPHGSPILEDVVDPDTAGRIARTRSVNFQDFTDRLIAEVIRRTGIEGLDEATASRNLRGGLLAARDYAKSEVDRAWGEVDLSITGRPGGVINAVEDMLAQARSTPAVADNYPVQILEAIRQQLLAGTRTRAGTPGTPPTVSPLGPTGVPVGTWQPGQGIPPLAAGRVQFTPGTPGTPGGTALVWRDNVPVKELHEIRSRLLRESDRVSEVNVLQPRPNLTLARNIDSIVDELTNSIEAVGSINPRFMPAYQYARDANRLYFERFRRGPVGELLMVTRQTPFAREGDPIPIGGARVPPTRVARQMLEPNETAMAVREAGQRFMGQVANPPVGGLAQARVLSTGDEAVRTMFSRDIMDFFTDLQNRAAKPRSIEDIPTEFSTQAGPVRSAVTRAQQWVRDNTPLLEGWTRTTTQLGQTVARLSRLLEARNEHTQSVLAQFIGRNAKEVFEESLRAPNVAERFDLMYRTFRNNPTFLEGAQRAIIDMVFAGRGGDPSVALQRMSQGNYREALMSLFQGDRSKLDRLYKMTEAASRTLGDVVNATQGGRAHVSPGRVTDIMSPGERAVRAATTWVGRILGLQAGGIVARTLPFMGSAGSLSIPMRWGRGASEYVAYQWIKDRKEALSIVRDAVFDPHYEARIHDLAPGNFREMQAQHRQLLRHLRRFEAVANEDVNEVLTGNSNRLYWDERRKVREEMARVRRGPFREEQ